MENDNITVADPFVFSPSQAWDGNDGRWSTFIIRVGTPEQNFRILPSTSGQETFIPVPEGCTSSDPTNCGSLRGVYPFDGSSSSGFQSNSSSTWKPIGLYDLVLGHQLNYTGNGLYGFDTIGLALQNSGGLTLKSQTVAGIATKDFYLGIFGLGPKPSNFSDFEYPQPSFMRNLKEERQIPSLSFAYTAGAAYRIPKLPGSLTLGGYDKSRFTSSDQTFPFSADDSRVLSVGVQQITATNTLLGTRSFLDHEILTLIDSTFPHIWLPRASCDLFEEAFGLIYDPHTDLYVVNDTIHKQLQDLNPTITFSLGNENNAIKTVTIQLPYAAFDLQASHPIYENATNYFPIRRAANDTQYTLGRAFLQEAYVIADYERSNFSVHQALFESSMPDQEIISILSPSQANETTESPINPSNSHVSGGGLPTPTIIGIGVGAGILVVILAVFLIIFYQRRKAMKQRETDTLSAAPSEPHYASEMRAEGRYEMFHPPVELKASKNGVELLGDVSRHEMPADGDNMALRHEMPGDGDNMALRHEMPGDGDNMALRHEMPGDGDKNTPRHELGIFPSQREDT